MNKINQFLSQIPNWFFGSLFSIGTISGALLIPSHYFVDLVMRYPKMMTIITILLFAFSLYALFKLFYNPLTKKYSVLWDKTLSPYCPVHRTPLIPNKVVNYIPSGFCPSCDHYHRFIDADGNEISLKDIQSLG